MSYRIEYQWRAFLLPSSSLGLSEDRFVIAIEGGNNNVCNPRTGRRSRSWSACLAGTHDQVLREAVGIAGCCEGGSLQPHGRYCTPESYIRRIRQLIAQAKPELEGGYWRPRLRVSQDHSAATVARQLGLDVQCESRYGCTYSVASVSLGQLAAYFGLFDRYSDELPAWCWFEVGGLRAS